MSIKVGDQVSGGIIFDGLKCGSVVKIILNKSDPEGRTINSYVMRCDETDDDNTNVGITIMSPKTIELGIFWGPLTDCDYEIIKIV